MSFLLIVKLMVSLMPLSAVTAVDASILDDNKAFARVVAAETMVLLRNENDALPLAENEAVSVFGVAQVNYYKGGSGSGNVNASYSVSPLEGMLANGRFNINADLATEYVLHYGSTSGNLGEYLPGTNQQGTSNRTNTSEPEITDEMLQQAVEFSDTAIVTISRTSGEDSDRTYTKGSYLLTDDEEALLEMARENFEKVVVILNLCGPIDTKWVGEYEPDAILFVGMPGMEGGNAIADVLIGDVNPSAKLTETWAYDYYDIPSSHNFGSFIKGTVTITEENLDSINAIYRSGYWGMVPNREPYTTQHIGQTIALDDYYYTEYEEGIYVGYRYFETFGVDVSYEFGFGLSYTTFHYNVDSVEVRGDQIVTKTTVTNTGDVVGKEVIQVYYGAPDGLLERAAKELAGYGKTDLLEPGEAQQLTITFDIDDMAGYYTDDANYILEAGDYNVYIGTSVRTAWYYEPVNTLTGLLVVQGVSESEFEPERETTRAEFTQLLYNLATSLGLEPEENTSIPFTDMPRTDY